MQLPSLPKPPNRYSMFADPMKPVRYRGGGEADVDATGVDQRLVVGS
jgi:hypothetical protein